jgi:hypothetical protein
MFQINSMLLRKMGWTDHSSPTFNSPRFDDNDLVRFYIKPDTIYFFIKDISEEEKQISKNSYKFQSIYPAILDRNSQPDID